MINQVAPEPIRLSKEPGFVSFDIFRPPYVHKLPVRTPGLLAFLRIEDGVETVVRLLLFDDVAKGFAQSRPFCGHANVVAYREFPASGDMEQYKRDLTERFSLFAELTEKYRAPQTVWPLDEYATIPPM